MKEQYYVGLDIGTESVGWAVTDTQYQIKKVHGKALWGVRLFDEAQSARDRRGFRVARRRIQRRRQRLDWLQEQFAQVVGEVDPGFFQRMEESRFWEEDKRGEVPLGKYTLFGDKSFTDWDYHHTYPTIYHLRKELILSQQPHDVRLVYLAIHHILKNRGHFLYGDMSLDAISLDKGMERLNGALEREEADPLSTQRLGEVREILLDHKIRKTAKKAKLLELFGSSKEKTTTASVVELLTGSKVSLSALYGEEVSSEELQKLSLEDDFDGVEGPLLAAVGDRIELVLAAKEVYDWALLEKMRDGEQYLSFAKVKVYENHRHQLEQLKEVVKRYGGEDCYREMFHGTREGNYPSYVGKDCKSSRCDYDTFCKYVLGKMKGWKDADETTKEIYARLERRDFLRKPTSKDNGVIPHQLHQMELEKILANAQGYLPFLSQRDESGLTVAERIVRMFAFRIPYYVGPLQSGGPHSWVVRSGEKIYPWNFDQVVDLEQCRENFITRMTAKCTYIGEDVLPKDSLLYSRFMVLNELNNLRINGKPISVRLKQDLYTNLFGKGRKVTQAGVKKYLMAHHGMTQEDTISGLAGDFQATLAPWRQFGWLLSRDGGEDMVEEIIRYKVLFGEDKKLLRGWLDKTYGDKLTPQEQKQVLGVKCSGWGRLSRQFLTQLFHVDQNTGEAFSIMDLLWNSNENLMQLLSGRYTFAQQVEEYRKRKQAEHSQTLKEYLAECYASPGIKRGIYQTMAIVREIAKIMGGPPARVFVEMARGEEKDKKGKAPKSRKAQLVELYQKCGEESSPLFEQLQGEPEGNLRRDKLYLYYTQMGRCMYSGDVISIAELDSRYDIDHIYPQSKTKDDSLENRVLVRRELNSKKGDTYPISGEIREHMRAFWTMLKGKGLISEKKYQRLTRATGFDAQELSGFIARQLVEARQSSKIVAQLLEQTFGASTEVVYVKAGNVAQFRQDQRITPDGQSIQAGECKGKAYPQDPLFVKCREVNDFHHAKDAYLNIVVGNVYHVKFTRSPANFLREKDNRYSLNRMFDFDVQRGGEVAWKAGESIQTVRRTMAKNNILFTRRAAMEMGGLYKQTIRKAREAGEYELSIKSTDDRLADVQRYGYYTGIKTCAFFAVRHTPKKKSVVTLEPIFTMYRERYERDPIGYCTDILKLHEPRILVPCIKINALVSFDGFRMHISGRTGDRLILKNANQLVIEPAWQQYIKGIVKYLERCKVAGRELELTRFDGITKAKNILLYDVLLSKLENHLYSVQYDSIAKVFRDKREAFVDLREADQCRLLIQILILFRNRATDIDISLIGGPKNKGKIRISNMVNPKKTKQFTIINQSVTGFYEQTVDLLRV